MDHRLRGIFGCSLCGITVFPGWDEELVSDPGSDSWVVQFRGLYSGPEGIVLTGVGFYEGPSPVSGIFIAPRDRNVRWSDAGYGNPTADQFGVLSQPGVNGRRGFIFHEACWNLLEEALHPAPVSLQRLFDVCGSLPISLIGWACANWGHDYGGVYLDNENFFPWDDRFEHQDVPDDPHPMFGTIYTNPYHVLEVDDILAAKPEEPPPPKQTPLPATAPGEDCFTRLPEELRAAIAMYLCTADVLSARLASRAFWPVFYSQQFWASRFKASTDRSWLFEARRGGRRRDWRWLYRRTNDAKKIGPGLRNRRRIWGLIQGVVDILGLVWNELPLDLAPVWAPDPIQISASHRTEAAGDLWEGSMDDYGRNAFHRGCRIFQSQRVTIPDNLSRLSASTVALGDGTYIAGLSLTSAAGHTIRLGYCSPSEQSIEMSQVWGLRLAVGPRGIKALQCITGPTDPESPWLGCPDDVPRTERLVVGSRALALEAAFDGCKMVSLALYTPSILPEEALPGRNDLRDSALWHPNVPAPTLCLNEDSFPQSDSYTSGYKPLFWCHFGGPGGRYLPHLTRILATWGFDGIQHFDFFFDTEVPAEHRSFGRMRARRDDDLRTTFDFLIDGPGGERIQSIELGHFYPGWDLVRTLSGTIRNGTTLWCELRTNRGRSCCICYKLAPSNKASPAIVRERITPAPGFAITGFYATKRPQCVSSVGVVSEKVEDDDS